MAIEGKLSTLKQNILLIITLIILKLPSENIINLLEVVNEPKVMLD